MADPFLDRYGGSKGVARLVFRFYDLVLASERLAPFFDGIDMPALVEHQANFIASVAGGRAQISDAELAAVHGHLGIGAAEFDEMVALLAEAIELEGHPPEEAGRVLQHFRRLRSQMIAAVGGGSGVEA
jgi:hemoglobin